MLDKNIFDTERKLPDAFTHLSIPANIFLIKDLTDKEKMVLAYVYSMEFSGIEPGKTTRKFFASNEHLCNIFGVSDKSMTRIVTNLVEGGFLIRNIGFVEPGSFIKKRILSALPYHDLLSKMVREVEEEQPKQAEQSEEPVQPKKTENKDKPEQPKETENIPYKEIVEYFNEKVGTKCRHTTKATQKLIKGRWNEGYVLEDFKTVIDKKVIDWLGTDMQKYLVFETIFAPRHFDKYLNQIVSKKESQKKYPEQQPVQGNNKFDFGFVNPQ